MMAAVITSPYMMQSMILLLHKTYCHPPPLQLLITRLKALGYKVGHSCHDDQKYVFNYRLPEEAASSSRHLTVPI